jgi:GMC oxidoreductase/FAD dependent oxidoreductase
MMPRMSVIPASAQVPTQADVVVVGGGFAGLAVAGELEARGVRDVVVLESGPDAGREHYRAVLDEDTAVRRWLRPESDTSFWRPYRTNGGPHYGGIAGLRRRVGGRSLYWHGVALPIEPWALADGAWPEPVVTDLTTGYQGGASLYARVDGELAEWAGGATTSGPAVTVGDFVGTPTPQAVRAAGGDGRWAAFSPLSWWTSGTASVPIVADCHVAGVTLDRGAVTGVRVRHGSAVSDICTRCVVLAAGTVENSRLAMQSLVETGDLARPCLPGLVDKIAHGFAVTFDAADLPADLVDAAHQGVFCYAPAADHLRSNHFLILYRNEHGAIVLDTWLMGEQTGGEHGRVVAEPGDWPWAMRVAAGLGPADERLCRDQQHALGRLWEQVRDTVGLRGGDLAFDAAHGSADLPDRLLAARAATGRTEVRTYSFPLGAEQHEAGTTPLGSMLDDRHQFRAVPGLYAAGPSTFPRSGAANPAVTILALAKRLAGKLADVSG